MIFLWPLELGIWTHNPQEIAVSIQSPPASNGVDPESPEEWEGDTGFGAKKLLRCARTPPPGPRSAEYRLLTALISTTGQPKETTMRWGHLPLLPFQPCPT